MKKLLLLAMFAIAFSAVKAQSDTLLYENFDVDPTANYLQFNSGNDTQWVNFDADGLPDANSRPQEWYWSDGAFASADSLDACLFSSSWLAGFLFGNRNWLMTPPIQIVDANAVLSWASAPRQTPLYLDGYSVLVSTTDNIESSFTDTIFQAAQYISGGGFDYAGYVFSPGFVHGMDGTYVELDATNDSSRFVGQFRPFSANLAQYAGQTIYVAFVHDSDDDNLIALDDIMITGTATGITEIKNNIGLSVYPNPATDKIEMSYSLPFTSPVIAEIYDLKGSKVTSLSKGIQIAGSQRLAMDVSPLAAGTYTIVIKINGGSSTSKFVKN